MLNLGKEKDVEAAMRELAQSGDLREQELDAGLGNGGLGRLAACFLDFHGHARYPGARVWHPL